MDKSDTRALVRDLYVAYAAGDADRVAELLDDDIDWMIYAPITVFSFAGPRRGRAAAMEVLSSIRQDYVVQTYAVEVMIVDGDRAAVMSDATYTQRSTGRTLRFRLADILRVRDGRLVEFREFVNSFDVVEQALGRFLDVQ